ncbi:MAG: hypothetical protein H0W50_05995 [Parachlamydiaceae bacterium]|nr:hypothetical protein [Parachlamydiaceae bacterium]
MQHLDNYINSKYPVLLSQREEYYKNWNPYSYISQNFKQVDSRLMTAWDNSTETIKALVFGILSGIISIEPLIMDTMDLKRRIVGITFHTSQSLYSEMLIKTILANFNNSISFNAYNSDVIGYVSGPAFLECNIAGVYCAMLREIFHVDVQHQISQIKLQLQDFQIRDLIEKVNQLQYDTEQFLACSMNTH